jgi:hypothetical protein
MGAPKGNEYWKARLFSGRSKMYETPEALADAIAGYFNDVDENPLYETQLVKVKGAGGTETVKSFKRKLPRCTTMAGLCTWLDLTLNAFRDYEERKEFVNVVAHARQIMYERKLEGAAAGIYNPSIIARDLGLTEKSEQTIIQEQPLFSLDPDKPANE